MKFNTFLQFKWEISPDEIAYIFNIVLEFLKYMEINLQGRVVEFSSL